MESLLKSTLNTRIVPGTYRFIRSDLPNHLTEDEKQWLLEDGVKTAVDLRTNDEYTKWPSSFENDDRFTVLHMPVTLINDGIAENIDEMTKIYAGMVDEQLTNILDTILQTKGKVLYFCYTGKDRTGVVTAMLMRRLGYGKACIIADYMSTKTNMEKWIIDFCQRNPEYPLEICMPNLKFISPILNCGLV